MGRRLTAVLSRPISDLARAVSERRRVEEALSNHEARLRAVLETAVDGIITINDRGVIESFNRAAERLFGYPAGEIIGRNVRLLMPSPPEELLESCLAKPRDTGVHKGIGIACEVLGRRRDGSTFPMELSVSEVRLGGRRIVTGIVRDITRRKRDERFRQLQYETSRLLAASGTLAETVPRLLQSVAETFQWDVGEFWEATVQPQKMRVVHAWHRHGPNLAGFVKHSMGTSLSMSDGLPGRVLSTRKPEWIPDVARCPHFVRKREAARAGLRSALAFPIWIKDRTLGAMAFLTHRLTGLDEDLLQVLASLGGQIGQFMERKRAEEALREAHEFGRQVINGAQAGIIVSDRDGRVVVWNPFMEQITGYPAKEVLGRRAVDTFPLLRKQHFEEMLERALAGAVFDAADISFDLPEKGKRGWTAARFAPWRNAQGQILGAIVAVRDITERRRLEGELLEITDREQRRIGQDLHDGLGQRLTGLEMKCFGLLDDLAGHDLSVNRKKLQDQALQLNQALRECITLTRSIARGLTPVVLRTGGLIGALEQLAQDSRVAGKIDCRFVCSSAELPGLLHDSQAAKHLYRIAQEAVNNALKHGRTRRIRVSLAQEQGVLRLQVRDDGGGLPLNRTPGSGMGLEVMRHRAHVIGASLQIDSAPGRGVTVTCALPLENHEKPKTHDVPR